MAKRSKHGRRLDTSLHVEAWCIPKRWVELSSRSYFSETMCENATWSHRVNTCDFLVAEAYHVQIQPSTRSDLPRDAPAGCTRQPRQHLRGEPATMVLQVGTVRITNGRKRSQRMAFRLQARDNVKRLAGVLTEIRQYCSSRISSKSSGVRSCCLPPTQLGAGPPRLKAATR